MMMTLVYVNRATYDIVNEIQREEIITGRACDLAENQELFEEFLKKRHYKRVELLYYNTYTAHSIQTDFFSECCVIAEEEFKKNYVEKTFKIGE